jgi:hypothetical protein
MKKGVYTILFILIGLGSTAQGTINQNTEFKKVAMFSGRTIVQDTCLLIKSGNDTIRITNYGDKSRLSTTAGGGWLFSPPLPGTGTNQKFAPTRVPFAAADSTLTTSENFLYSDTSFQMFTLIDSSIQSGLFSNNIIVGPFTIPITSISRTFPSGKVGGYYIYNGSAFGGDSLSLLIANTKQGLGTDGTSISLEPNFLNIEYSNVDTLANMFMSSEGILLASESDSITGSQIKINSSGSIELNCSGIATYNGVEIATVSSGSGTVIYPNFSSDTLFAHTENYQGGQIGLVMLGDIPKQMQNRQSIAGNILIGTNAGNELQQPETIYDNCVGNTILGDNAGSYADSLSRATLIGWQSQGYDIVEHSKFYRGITAVGASTSVLGDYGTAIGGGAQAAKGSISLNAYQSAQDSFMFSIPNTITKIKFELNDDSLALQCQGCILTNIDGFGLAQWTWSSQSRRDSVNIYSLTSMPDGTQVYCYDCTGNGITGRILAFIGNAWRRLKFD